MIQARIVDPFFPCLPFIRSFPSLPSSLGGMDGHGSGLFCYHPSLSPFALVMAASRSRPVLALRSCPRSFLCSGLFWSGLLPPCLLPSFFYRSFRLPSPGGWLVTVLFSVVIPPILRSSLLFLSLLLPWPGEGWWWYCSLLSPVPSGDFPCLTCLSFFILSSGWFCSVLCPSFRLSFFPFLSFSLSFSLFPYLFLSSRGGWLVTVLFLLCRRLSFFPLSFVFSSFVLPREWW